VLRHTAAVWMAEAGIPMAEIAQYLGHSDDRITSRVYARYGPDHLRKAAAAIRW
jgi:integrase